MPLTIDDVREMLPVARSYMWDIVFPDFPGKTFPATVVGDEAFAFENDSMNFGPWQFDFPKSAAQGNINVTVFELDDFPILKWLKTWLNAYCDAKTWGIGLIGQMDRTGVTRRVSLVKYKTNGDIGFMKDIYVIPASGTISYDHTSDKNGTLQPSLTFTIVGD